MREDYIETNMKDEDGSDCVSEEDFKIKDENHSDSGDAEGNNVSNTDSQMLYPLDHSLDQLLTYDFLKKEESKNVDNKNSIKIEVTFANIDQVKKQKKVPKSRKEFSVACGVCGKEFKKTSRLTTHMVTHTGEKNFKCHLCPDKFGLKGTLSKHVKVIHDKIPDNKPRSICEICNKYFSCKQWMEEHKITAHTEEFQTFCQICGVGLTKRRIKQHKITCEARAELIEKKCITCGRSFSMLNELDLHMIQVHKENCYFTCHCGKEFQIADFRQLLREHRVVCHATQGDNKYPCSTCGKGFDIKYYFDAHMRRHKGEKPYQCESCGKSFGRKENLALHTKLQLGLKEFKCSLCGKTFVRKDGLKVHEKTHTKEKPFGCDICEKRFSDKANLITHKKNQHSELTSDNKLFT